MVQRRVAQSSIPYICRGFAKSSTANDLVMQCSEALDVFCVLALLLSAFLSLQCSAFVYRCLACILELCDSAIKYIAYILSRIYISSVATILLVLGSRYRDPRVPAFCCVSAACSGLLYSDTQHERPGKQQTKNKKTNLLVFDLYRKVCLVCFVRLARAGWNGPGSPELPRPRSPSPRHRSCLVGHGC